MSKRKTAQQRAKEPPKELAPEERYTVISPLDESRIYYGKGVSKEDAMKLGRGLLHGGIVVRVSTL